MSSDVSDMGNKSGHKPTPRRRPRLRLFCLGLLALGGLALVGMVGLHATGTASQVQAVLDVARPWLRATQLAAIALLWLRWRSFIEWLARHGRIEPAAVEPLVRARDRVITLLLVIHVTVVMRLPMALLEAALDR